MAYDLRMRQVTYSGASLREERVRQQITPTKLAADAGVSENTLRNYELGKTEPPVSTLGLLGQALGVQFVPRSR